MKFMFKFFFPCVLCFISTFVDAAPTKISSFSTAAVANHLNIDINLSQSGPYHYFSLSDPNRLVIDFKDTQTITAQLPDFSNTPWIKRVRAATHSAETQRIVFEFTEKIKSKLSLLPPSASNTSWHVRIELQAPTTSPVSHTSKDATIAAITPTVKQLLPTLKTADAHLTRSRCVNIVIDPGHGGKDSGAVSAHGTKEKNITLAISKYLADLINHSPGMCAHLTRTDDSYISLRGRINFARKKSADLFIAIHADMFKDKTARGATVFALSQRGATSEAARWIAHNENVDDLLEIGEADSKDKNLQSILMDISQNETINRSLILGKDVLRHLDNVSKLHHTIVEQAGFVVLKSPDIPSILVETGFLSNAYEEQKLLQSSYQKSIALAIYHGLMEYTRQYPFPLLDGKVKR